MDDLIYFSCLNYNNVDRKTAMEERFKQLNITCTMYKGVNPEEDKRFISLPSHANKRVISCMYGHLDMIHAFYYTTDKKYGIFCEDDIYLHKDFSARLFDIIHNDMDEMKIDILLLGYLFPSKIDNIEKNTKPYNYYHYGDDLWGAQMYLLTREYAKFVLDKYSESYLEKTLIDSTLTPFSADWTITKNGKRFMVYPMLAVEDGKYKSGDYYQDMFHTNCHVNNYIPGLFI